jgi:hypothetical protein
MQLRGKYLALCTIVDPLGVSESATQGGLRGAVLASTSSGFLLGKGNVTTLLSSYGKQKRQGFQPLPVVKVVL